MDDRRGRRPAAAAALALAASTLTPLYEPFTFGRDDAWAIAIVVGGALLAAGATLPLGWALAFAAAYALGGFVAADLEDVAWLLLIFGVPIAAVLVLAGHGLARLVRGRGVAVAAVALAVAAVPAALAAISQVRRASADRVPPALLRELPVELSLGNLCPGSELPPREAARLRAQTDVLMRELERDPDRLLPYTYHFAHGGSDEAEITIRELAEEQLADLESGGADCAPDLRRRLRDAL